MGYHQITGGKRSPSLCSQGCSVEMDFTQESRIIELIIQLSAEADEVAAEIRGLRPRQEPERYLKLMRHYEYVTRSIGILKVRRAELEVAV